MAGSLGFAYLHYFRRSDDGWMGSLNPMSVTDAWAEADRINGDPNEDIYAKVLADNSPSSVEVPKPRTI